MSQRQDTYCDKTQNIFNNTEDNNIRDNPKSMIDIPLVKETCLSYYQ